MRDYNNHSSETHQHDDKEAINYQIPRVSKLILDKLAFTAKLEKQYWNSVTLASGQLVKKRWLKESSATYATFRAGSNTHKYLYSFDVLKNGKSVGFIQFHPKKDEIAFLRVSCNPAKVGPVGCRRIVGALRGLLGRHAMAVICTSKVTILHVALDVENLEVDDLLLADPYKQLSGKWATKFAANGSTETVTIGSSKRNQLTTYNKAAQLRECEGVAFKSALTRFEFKMNGVSKRPADLSDLKNPFRNLIVGSTRNINWSDLSEEQRFFIDSCKLRGAHAALKQAKKGRKRAKYAALLRDATPDWWKPEKSWLEFFKLIQVCGLFPSSMFSERGGAGLRDPGLTMKGISHVQFNR